MTTPVSQKTQVRLHDGNTLEIEIYGAGPNILLPVRPQPFEGARADEMRQYGADPALGQSLIQGLSDKVRVIAFDYEGHVLQTPKPLTLTPDNIAADFLAVADAAQADRFAYYGYSWLATAGIQLAVRTNRVSALAVGGFPPIYGPYQEMVKVTTASYDIARGAATSPNDKWSGEGLSVEGTQQFVTMYEALQTFDDIAAQAKLTCPRLCFAGSKDEIEYGQGWGEVVVSLAGPLLRERERLEAFGWKVVVLDGLDHMSAMLPGNVLPILRPWLMDVLK